MYSSTCFWRPHAHHQKLNNYISSLWFYRWSVVIAVLLLKLNHHHHHHKHPGLGQLARSVSRVTVALSIVSLVSQLFSYLVGCKGIILKGFGFVAFFAASSFSIHISCLVCSLSEVRGEWSCLFCSHKGRNLPEVSIASFLPPQFFVSVRLSKSKFLTHTKM
jgi:hypothetical protein